jgi:arylsulfatase
LISFAATLVAGCTTDSQPPTLVHLDRILNLAEIQIMPGGPAVAEDGYFEFNEGTDGWEASTSVTSLSANSGFLNVTAGKSFHIRSPETLTFDTGEIVEIEFMARSAGIDSVAFGWETRDDSSGAVTIEAADGDGHHYVIPTASLSNWTGDLRSVSLSATATSETSSLELDYLRLIRRSSLSGEAAGVAKIWADRVQRECIFIGTPGRIEYELSMPPDAKLSFGAKVLSAQRPIQFTITIRDGGKSTGIFDRALSNANVWKDFRIDLSAWAGRTVRLEFQFAGGKSRDIAFVACPIVYTPDRDVTNMIVYLIDALRPDHTSVYGYERETTPVIKSLAEKGVVFERAYSATSRTVESVPAIMTGLPSTAHGIRDYGVVLNREVPLLQEILRNNGYATASFITNISAGPKVGLDRGFDHLFDAIRTMRSQEAVRTLPKGAVFSWLEINADKPFFIYIHTAEPHAPYAPPEPFASAFKTTDAQPVVMPSEDSFAAGTDALQATMDAYDAEILFADAGFGLLVEKLQELGIMDRTVIVVMADHGEEFGEHGMSMHGYQLYEESVRIPFVFIGERVPGAPAVVNSPVSTLDLKPTVLGLLGVEAKRVGLSRNLFGHDGLAGIDSDRIIFIENNTPGHEARAIVKDHWKLIEWVGRQPPGQFELYDLLNDPGEFMPVDDPSVFETMQASLSQAAGVYRPLQREGHAAEMDAETEERLKALGYID